MTPDLRAAIAAMCISDSCKSAVVSLYDHEAGVRRRIEAEVAGGRAVSFDAETGHSLGGDLPELWHSGAQAWVHVAATGNDAYDGHDRASGAAFAVRVTGAAAQVYDHEQQAWTAYTGQLLAAAF